MRIFKLNEVKFYAIAGYLDVSLEAGGKSVSQDVEIRRDVDSEDVLKLESAVRDRLTKRLVDQWVGKLGKMILK